MRAQQYWPTAWNGWQYATQTTKGCFGHTAAKARSCSPRITQTQREDGFTLAAEVNDEMEAPADAPVTVRAGELQTSFTARLRPLEIWICGNVYPAAGLSGSAYWHNGEQTILTDDQGNPAERTSASGIYVNGDDLYICGRNGSAPAIGKTGPALI